LAGLENAGGFMILDADNWDGTLLPRNDFSRASAGKTISRFANFFWWRGESERAVENVTGAVEWRIRALGLGVARGARCGSLRGE
jgi:hypothetical protein